ncbi:N-formylglutamate amidohydrolase [Marinicella sp. S1101]|uniref:N-formylglutamate amidohydrolase n=1 Tax=Marinicella marina TaxID=2996016 RepID=UPI00226091E4|nr:N-formylglutamate amidohydrolase [Marinicella marina]MCX7553871.1 N-formylglutamate amidohydrolase [Marinicella marina]MDJ1140363.1 N-formylglutamate amidohydrolase [Marinicella marina]
MSLFELRQETSPLVISVPHDGAQIPDDIAALMNPAVMGSTDRDLLINEVFEFEGFKYSKIKANYARHVIDLNRPASGEALYHNQAETELCPTSTFDFQPIYKPGLEPDTEAVKYRIENYWQPYHNQLKKLIDQAQQAYGFCLLLDAHSIDDEVPRFFDGRLPDINVGSNAGNSCGAAIESLLMHQLATQEHYSYINNGRFKGGFITRHYGQPERGVHAIQLEHAKSAYLHKSQFSGNKTHKLRQFWQDLIAVLLKSLN